MTPEIVRLKAALHRFSCWLEPTQEDAAVLLIAAARAVVEASGKAEPEVIALSATLQEKEYAELIADAERERAKALDERNAQLVAKLQEAEKKHLEQIEAVCMRIPYTWRFEVDEEGDVIGTVAELNGCITHGATQADASRNLREAQAMWIASELDAGHVIPEADGPRDSLAKLQEVQAERDALKVENISLSSAMNFESEKTSHREVVKACPSCGAHEPTGQDLAWIVTGRPMLVCPWCSPIPTAHERDRGIDGATRRLHPPIVPRLEADAVGLEGGGMSDVYEDRQQEQRIREQAREAARKLYPDANVSQSAHVHVVEDSGAFVELHVWIPKEALVNG